MRVQHTMCSAGGVEGCGHLHAPLLVPACASRLDVPAATCPPLPCSSRMARRRQRRSASRRGPKPPPRPRSRLTPRKSCPSSSPRGCARTAAKIGDVTSSAFRDRGTAAAAHRGSTLLLALSWFTSWAKQGRLPPCGRRLFVSNGSSVLPLLPCVLPLVFSPSYCHDRVSVIITWCLSSLPGACAGRAGRHHRPGDLHRAAAVPGSGRHPPAAAQPGGAHASARPAPGCRPPAAGRRRGAAGARAGGSAGARGLELGRHCGGQAVLVAAVLAWTPVAGCGLRARVGIAPHLCRGSSDGQRQWRWATASWQTISLTALLLHREHPLAARPCHRRKRRWMIASWQTSRSCGGGGSCGGTRGRAQAQVRAWRYRKGGTGRAGQRDGAFRLLSD